ncbi:hypothetical protein NDU88_005943 [Pleurodeles waltl]|uniref:Uncharacterized protein n=1 Tax=Pleurodeles waltl TaxID=8319 RepID=A0AAV7L906_PLEWA|nr:hypothetical protein NDU88_005943 [Pleurodeles waltl]
MQVLPENRSNSSTGRYHETTTRNRSGISKPEHTKKTLPKTVLDLPKLEDTMKPLPETVLERLNRTYHEITTLNRLELLNRNIPRATNRNVLNLPKLEHTMKPLPKTVLDLPKLEHTMKPLPKTILELLN